MTELENARKKINEIDEKMAELFVSRMKAVQEVAEYKQTRGLPVLDEKREAEVVQKNAEKVKEQDLKEYYVRFLKNNMSVSRAYQERLLAEKNKVKTLICSHGSGTYPIFLGKGLLEKADTLFNLQRKVLIVTDSGVPQKYADRVAELCKQSKKVVVPQGESTKNFAFLERLCKEMLDFEMTRKDCVVAVGGGVVGDLAGFAASVYMRGVDFYNIPTTLLSQVDSSVGGKTAVDLGGVKNPVGAFYPPKGVLIDTDTLKTLPARQFACGVAEAVKMAVTLDKEWFERLETADLSDENEREDLVFRAVWNKKAVVEEDEKESGKRKVLNFGHTLGHAIEGASGKLYHGECVAIGMLFMCSQSVRERLKKVLERFRLPTETDVDERKIAAFLSHDKKSVGGGVDGVFVDEIGSFRIQKTTKEELLSFVKKL